MNKESLFLFLTRRRRRECEKGRRRERRSDLVPPRVEFVLLRNLDNGIESCSFWV